MKNRLYTLLIGIFTVVSALAQEDNLYYEDAIYKENIKTVLAYRDGFELTNPIMSLNEDMQLVFQFDDISDEVKDFYYTVVHCDADWNETNLVQADYIEGFETNPITDYALSYNTSFNYVNYQLKIPNDFMKLKLSGNYALVVFEDADKNNKVLTRRFKLYENLVTVDGSVRRASKDAFKGARHEVDFKIYHPNFPILNARDEVKVVITQNNRWDNAIRDLKPLYIRKGVLDYNYDKNNVFEAGNEFRYFDNRSNSMNGEYVASTEYHRPYYHKTLTVDYPRSNKTFFSYEEMNGRYTIESQDKEVVDYSTECDYTFVHFTLGLESPLLGGSIHVFGNLTNWNTNKSNELTFNFNTGAYELSLLLKQGYYNYMYVYVPEGASKADHSNIEGSFWEAENEYQILVYYRELAGRYDRLIGYTQLNSASNRY